MTSQSRSDELKVFLAKQCIADKIEALIALLDAMDGDTDLEDFLEGDDTELEGDETEDLEPEVDCAVDDMPCDDYDEGLEPEPWQWRQKERAAAAGRIIAKRTDELIINDPYRRPVRVRALK